MKQIVLFGLLFVATSSFAGQDPGNTTITDRYTMAVVEPQTAMSDPLQTLVTAAFATNIITIGEAFDQLLEGTGYRIRRNTKESFEHVLLDSILLNQPLPAAHRELGPIQLVEILKIIAGPAWKIQDSPLSRSVSFSLAKNTSDEVLSMLVSEVEGLKYTQRKKYIPPVKRAPAYSDPVAQPVLSSDPYQELALATQTTIDEPEAENQSASRRNYEANSDAIYTNQQKPSVSLPERPELKASQPTAATQENLASSKKTGAKRIDFNEGESLVKALIQIRKKFDLHQIILSIKNSQIDINQLNLPEDMKITKSKLHGQGIDFESGISAFIVKSEKGEELVVTDNPLLTASNTSVFMIRPGSIRSNAERLTAELKWKMPLNNGWRSKDFPVSASYPIAISSEDPRQAFIELLMDYPVQAQLIPTTETVVFVYRPNFKQAQR